MIVVVVCAPSIRKNQKGNNYCDDSQKDLSIEDKVDSIDKYEEANQADERSQKHLLLNIIHFNY
jgi:hypothetical protein